MDPIKALQASDSTGTGYISETECRYILDQLEISHAINSHFLRFFIITFFVIFIYVPRLYHDRCPRATILF